MKQLLLQVLLLVVVLTTPGFNVKQQEPSKDKRKAEKISLAGFKNLYKINDSLYRSEQPDKGDMQSLQKLGIRTIVSLRYYHRNDTTTHEHTLALQHHPIKTRQLSYAYILSVLKTINKVQKPILIHCMHGSDRTGTIIACYRMVYEKWTREEAIAEFKEEQFGYHEKWYPELLTLLQTIDIQSMQKELDVK